MRAGIYLRISVDRDGTSTANARQLEDCRKLAEARGWTVADTFEDSDVSAYKRGTVRPEFERMIEAIRAREIDVVLAWKLDRLARRLKDFARVDEECEAAGARVVTLIDGIDTGTSAGRVVASVMTAMARAESENISVRGARKAREMAQQGRPQTGGSRAFGYSRDRQAIDEREAELIREAVRRVLAGDSIRGICLDWERRGIVAPGGKAWQPSPLKRMLCSAALSAQREHKGVLSPGCWPAIITPEETEQIRGVLRNPNRRRSMTNARSYLLSGFLRCGHCGELLIARPDAKNGQRRYVCAKRPAMANCGKLARMSQPVEDTVFEALCVRLDGANLADYMETPADDSAAVFAAIREDEARLESLAVDHYRDNLLSRAEFLAARDALTARLDANREKFAKRGKGNVLTDVLAGAALRDRWPLESLDWRRAVIAALVDYVTILPAVKGKNAFDPALVDIRWRV